MKELTIVTVCSEMDDYLSWTLPHNKSLIDPGSYVVVCPDGDDAVAAVAERCGARLITCRGLFDKEAGKFYKGAMIDQALCTLRDEGADYILHLDCDILAGMDFVQICDLYMQNYMKDHPESLLFCGRFEANIEPAILCSLMERLPGRAAAGILEGCLSNWGPTNSVLHGRYNVGPWGFVQLFRLSHFRDSEHIYPHSFDNAGGDDAVFHTLFTHTVPMMQHGNGWTVVAHIPHGASQANWRGRTTPGIEVNPSLNNKEKD